MPKYTCTTQQRLLQVIDCLWGHEIEGIAPGQIASQLHIGNDKVTRDLANLVEAGWVEELPIGGRWRISPRVGQKAIAVLHTLDKAQKQLDDIKQRYTKPTY